MPLITKAEGTKFGKNRRKRSLARCGKKLRHMNFINSGLTQDDRDVVKFLKYFTF